MWLRKLDEEGRKYLETSVHCPLLYIGCRHLSHAHRRALIITHLGVRCELYIHGAILAPCQRRPSCKAYHSMRNRTAASVATSSAKRGSEGRAAHSENTLLCVWYVGGVICASFHRFLPVHKGEVGERADRDDPAYRAGASPEKEARPKAVSAIAFTSALGGALTARNLRPSSFKASDNEFSSGSCASAGTRLRTVVHESEGV
jgi:hypothetical protein